MWAFIHGNLGLYLVKWRAPQRHVHSETNESEGDFPTLPLRHSEAALHHRQSQYAPRTEQQKIVRKRKAEKREPEKDSSQAKFTI